ncbi:DUF169 domain-containing protein [Thermodesulfovibrionales bacterium]|nr:DUF169 domain-containing protein [Thermodesulfovibrionales bacterium]MCL0040031.1 DUF169 domain-containing protein [Thermodesulfovibrionales bacterium]MCL0042251.1 DUF169 domain-containing protein [Thermodesulfovibrionales bacterium]MCL0061708.1 DUF169 domain-containing protein [Thermodesulfovibrionales bacterium]MCL0068958.1 DUF169 domain-containing protein [Thermodesulfovibrionales bacterium]
MAIKEAMAKLSLKTSKELSYTDISDTYIYYIRVDFDPVGIKFCMDEGEIAKYPVNTKVRAKLTYCQFLAMARGGHKAIFMLPEKLLCKNAEPVFGFRELDREKDTEIHMKYLRDEKLTWEMLQSKAKLPLKRCKGVYVAPLAVFDRGEIDPDIVFFVCYPYQVYHILNDYMGGAGCSKLQIVHMPNSAVCGGSVWAFNNNTANMTTMCAGSKTSGKTEMTMLNLFLPGNQIKETAAQLIKRVADTGGPSVLGKGGEPWPGMDVCRGCPLFKYEDLEM